MNHGPRRTSASLVAALAVALLLVSLASASPAAAETFLSGYVTNEESPSLTKFNATTNQVDEQVEDQLEAPGQIAITADAAKAYVGEACHEVEPNHGTVVQSEVPSSGISRSIQLSTEGCASAIAISPKPDVGDTGETVWVVDGDEVFPIDSSDNSVGRPILPPDPCPASGCNGAEILQDVNDIAISPDGNTLYMLYTEEVLEGEHCQECGDDTSVDDLLLAFEVGGATAIPGEPVAVAIGKGKSVAVSADGGTAFTTTTSCHIDQICINTLDVYSLGPDPVRTNSQTFSLTEAGQIVLDPNGRWAWVAQTPGTFFLGASIETFELETGPPYEDEGHEFDEDDPIALAVAPDAKTLYVGFHDRETIAALETEGQGEVEIPVGEGAVGGIAITPAQAPEAKLEVHAGGEAEPTYFDASGSQITCNSAVCAEIAKYDWNFGDGKEETTTTPTTQHSYLGPGPFTATVTETSSEGVSTETIYGGHMMLENGGPQARATETVTLPTLATQA
jgi:DNA-binding beta-propeller fold protein YncE